MGKMEIPESNHQKIEQELKELKELFCSIPIGIIKCYYNKELPLIEANYWFYKMTGYTKEEWNLKFHKKCIEMIHPEDRDSIRNRLFESKENMREFKEEQYKILCADGSEKWILFSAQIIYGQNKEKYLYCSLTDINSEKNIIENLRQKAEKDALTGLYDKKAMQHLVEEYINSKNINGISALFMLDVDNFKAVNDTQGHLFGDAVLSELADGIKHNMRSTDLVGRVGGDEFSIFMKEIPSIKIAEYKAEQLLTMVKNLFCKTKQKVELSFSIGIAIFPLHGKNFSQLYQNADIALYQAKKIGKKQFVIFSEELEREKLEKARPILNSNIESNHKATNGVYQLIEYVFHTLYKTKDIIEAIPYMLDVVGKQYEVSRAYIFEDTEDGSYMNNTFEWCNHGIKSEKENLQHLGYNMIGDYYNNFDEDGVFYCKDISKLSKPQADLLKSQGICSVLQCIIYSNGKRKGFIGFDECTGNRFWTQEEINTLTLLSELLGTCLMEQRAYERELAKNEQLKRMQQQLREILDLQNAYIYLIDVKTYQLLYMNKKTEQLTPAVSISKCCYHEFFGREKPCDLCIVDMIKNGNYDSIEYQNSRYNLWVSTSAFPIQWNGKEAYLIISYDITKYKKIN